MRRLRVALGLFLLVVTIGTAGYMILGGWAFADAIYMTITTITTVGFREIRPLDTVEQYFTMALALAGVGTAFYLFASISEFMIEGHLTGFLAERRMKAEISRLKNHYILCGYGKVGENVAEEFKAAKAPFVVIETNHERVQECREKGFLCIEGDASSDEVLLSVGVDKAKGLVAAVDNDADNVFVTLTARVLNPKINIVARTILTESREKLFRAGANKVVSPSFIGGQRMAAIMLRPLVSDYLDVVTFGDDLEFRLEELVIGDQSAIRDTTLIEADIKRQTGVVVLAVKKIKTGEFKTSPASDTVFEPGDHLVVLGTKSQLDEIQKIV